MHIICIFISYFTCNTKNIPQISFFPSQNIPILCFKWTCINLGNVCGLRIQQVAASVPHCIGHFLSSGSRGSFCQLQPAFLAVLRGRAGAGGNGEAFAFLHTVNHVPTPVGEFRASWVVSSEIMLGRNKKRLLAEQRGSGIKQEGLHPRTRITKHSKQHCSHLYSQGFHKKLLSRFEVFI